MRIPTWQKIDAKVRAFEARRMRQHTDTVTPLILAIENEPEVVAASKMRREIMDWCGVPATVSGFTPCKCASHPQFGECSSVLEESQARIQSVARPSFYAARKDVEHERRRLVRDREARIRYAKTH